MNHLYTGAHKRPEAGNDWTSSVILSMNPREMYYTYADTERLLKINVTLTRRHVVLKIALDIIVSKFIAVYLDQSIVQISRKQGRVFEALLPFLLISLQK